MSGEEQNIKSSCCPGVKMTKKRYLNNKETLHLCATIGPTQKLINQSQDSNSLRHVEDDLQFKPSIKM